MKRLFLLALLLTNLTIVFSQNYRFYALSNDQGVSKPVYLCELDSVTGTMSVIENYSGVVGGNYYALSSDYKHLLVTSLNAGKNQGGLVQYDISMDGKLSLIKSSLKPGWTPCFVSFSSDMEYVYSANYGDDEISLYNFNNKTISPEIDLVEKPDQSRGHFIMGDPSDKFVHAVFLGLDRVYS
jgi:6-phosphogluconolactonase